MDIKQYLLERYKSEKLIYPFPDSKDFDKFIFAYIMDDLSEENEYKDRLFELDIDDNDVTSGTVFRKLKDNDKIKLFNYSFTNYQDQPIRHKIWFYSDDENFVLACQLVGNQEQLFKHLVK